MDKNLLQKAKASMIALIKTKIIMYNKLKTKTKRAAALLLMLALLAPLAAWAQSRDCNGPIAITADAPYIEGFESPECTAWNKPGPLPDCWEAYTTGTVAPHNIPDSHSGGFQALGFSNSGINYAILPEFGTDLNQLQISFWKTKRLSGNGQLILGYLTTEDDGTCNTFTEIATYEVTLGIYDLAHQSLLNVPTTAQRLAFKWAADCRCCIDDVIVALDANCYPEVGTLSLGGVTTTSAYLSWSLIDSTQNAWDVQVATDRDFTENVTNHVADSHENYLVEGLSPGTEYYVRVKPLCSISFWSNVIRLWTSVPCGGPITVTAGMPYTQGFESPQGSHYMLPGPLPTCWEGYNSTGNVPPHNTTAYFISGLQSLSLYGIGDSYALLPEFSNLISELQISFWMQTHTDTDGQLQLGYLTADDDGTCNTFTPVATYANSVDYVLRTTYLPNVPVTAVRLAFKWNGRLCCIDDVEVSICTLDCFPVGNMSVGEVTSNSAYLSWDLVDDSQTAWDVQVSTNAAFTNILVDEETDSHENYLLSGLSGSTHYYVRVRANCDDTHQSEWSNAIDFTTLCGPITITAEMPYFVDFESPEVVPYNLAEDPVPACWGHYTTGNVIPHIVKNDGLEGSQALMFYPNGDNYAILPEFSNPLNELQISFYMYSGGENAIFLQLGYLTAEDDGTCNTFTTIESYQPYYSSFAQRITYLPDVPATAARLAFKWSGNYLFYIDDVEVSLSPRSITITADAPYTQGFESPEGTPFNQAGPLPDCWQAYRTTINGLWPHNSTSWHHDGSQSLAFYNWYDPVFAILPEFSNPLSDLQISFWMTNEAGALMLGYLTAEDDGTCNTFTDIATYPNSGGTTTQRSMVLDNVPANAERLAFRWTGPYNDGLCFIDDVTVSLNPSMIPPRDIAATNITPHTADITWEGACGSYALRHREIPTLLKEGFEGGTMPEGWTIEGDNQDPAKTWRVGVGDHLSSTGTHSGNYNARITHNTNNQVTYLVTPALDLGEYASAELSFWYVNGKWVNETDEFAVCYRMGSGGEWHELWSTAVNHNTWTSQTVVLAGLADNYQIGFRFTDHYGYGVGLDDIALCEMPHSEWITFSEAESPHTLTGLATETDYEVQVKSNCAGYDDWSESFVFTTMGCEIPANVAVSDLTATGVTVSWTGFNDSYYLSYRQAPSMGTLFSEGFEGGTMPQGWTIEGDNQDPDKTWRVGVGDYSSETGTHSGNYNALITHNTNDQVTYLVTPAFDLGEYGSAELSFWFVNRKWDNDTDEFAICYRIGNEGEWNELWSTSENHQAWTSQTVELTGLADNYQIGFRFTDHFGWGVGLDDVALFDMTHSEWIILSEAESPQAITGLTPETEYEVKVQGVCDDISTEWSQPVVFSTPTGPAPVATLGTVTATTADLSWTASFCEGYTVKYREKSILMEEHFDGDDWPEGWSYNSLNSGSLGIAFTNFAGIRPNEVINKQDNDAVINMPAIDLSGISEVQLSLNFGTIQGYDDYNYFGIQIGIEGETLETIRSWRYPNNMEYHSEHLIATTANSYMGQSDVKFYLSLSNQTNSSYMYIDDIVIEGSVGEWQILSVADTAVTLTNLNPNTMYEVKVVPDCDENKESELLTFTTANPCEASTNLAVGNLTPYTAEVSWEGFSLTGYEVECYTVPLSEGFEGGTLPEGWTIEGDNQNSATTWRVGAGDDLMSTGIHSGDYNALITHNQDTDETFLVTPPLNLGAYEVLELSFWYINRLKLETFQTDLLRVYYRIDEDGEWNELWNTGFTGVNWCIYWTHQTLTLTDLADNYQIGFMMKDNNGLGVGLDDILISAIPSGNPMTLMVEEGTTATLTGLSANTTYEVRVKANCDAAEYCSPVVFTTAEMETFTKDILAHTNNGGWYLIASPVAETVTPTAQNGFLANEYDLYRFNQSAELEWENWKAEGEHYHFNLEAGQGYLYANSGDVTLTFVGTPHAATEPAEVPLAYDPAADFAGWNLVGNPLPGIAFIDRDFYVMNGNRDEIVAAEGNTVELMEGIFVIAEGENDTMTFTPASQNAIANNASLVVSLSQGRGSVIDRAIVRFNSNRTLPKFQLNPSSTKVYIQQSGKDYAVVAAEQTGEMPLNFKAEKNGEYTLSFNLENIEFDYLHLIDNLTGTDVDLVPLLKGQEGLKQPATYTFTAKTTDYASRFRLVFSSGVAGGDACEPDAPFAYVSNGEIRLLVETFQETSLQIVDMLGRVIRTVRLPQCDSPTTTTGIPAGVYVLRLIAGDSVRTQKIVIN